MRIAQGYATTSDNARGVTYARVLAGDGFVANPGQVAATGLRCVFDMTEPEQAS